MMLEDEWLAANAQGALSQSGVQAAVSNTMVICNTLWTASRERWETIWERPEGKIVHGLSRWMPTLAGNAGLHHWSVSQATCAAS